MPQKSIDFCGNPNKQEFFDDRKPMKREQALEG